MAIWCYKCDEDLSQILSSTDDTEPSRAELLKFMDSVQETFYLFFNGNLQAAQDSMSELMPPEPHDKHHKPKKSGRSGSKGRALKAPKKAAQDAVVNTQEEVKVEPKPVKENLPT